MQYMCVYLDSGYLVHKSKNQSKLAFITADLICVERIVFNKRRLIGFVFCCS